MSKFYVKTLPKQPVSSLQNVTKVTLMSGSGVGRSHSSAAVQNRHASYCTAGQQFHNTCTLFDGLSMNSVIFKFLSYSGQKAVFFKYK